MGLSKRLMASGVPAQTAAGINGYVQIYASVSTTVSQAAATPLLADINILPNAQAAGAVLLPIDAVVGDFVTVSNFTGSNISIYGTLGETINGLAANSPLVLATGSTVQLQQCTNTAWYAT
jgi:hypothetical protein